MNGVGRDRGRRAHGRAARAPPRHGGDRPPLRLLSRRPPRRCGRRCVGAVGWAPPARTSRERARAPRRRAPRQGGGGLRRHLHAGQPRRAARPQLARRARRGRRRRRPHPRQRRRLARPGSPGSMPVAARRAGAAPDCLENTRTRAGGTVLDPPPRPRRSPRGAERVHLDGARLANAAVALGVPLAELAAPADTVAFSLNKGLCAPVRRGPRGRRRRDRARPRPPEAARRRHRPQGRASSPPPASSRSG